MKKRWWILIIALIIIIIIAGFLIYNYFFSKDLSLEYDFDYESLGVKSGEDTGGEIGQSTDTNVFDDIKLNPFKNET